MASWLLIGALCVVYVAQVSGNAEVRLMQQLFSDYNVDARPVANASSKITVSGCA